MSNVSGLVSSGPFVRLPVELLEEVYVLSERHALPHVCRNFYIALSSESTRLRFCTRLLFYLDNPRKDPDQKDASVCDEKIKILSQEWYTADFATRVKAAVKRIRISDMIEYSSHYPLCVSDIHLPARLLRGPWSQSKLEVLGRLFLFGLGVNPVDKPGWHESMRDAMVEDNWEALEILLIVGPDLDRDGYKDLFSYGRGSIVWKLFNWLRDRAFMWDDDPELRNLVKKRGN